jgi:hypothetical protein
MEGVGKEGGRVEKKQRQKMRKYVRKATLLCCRRTLLQSLLLADIGKANTCRIERQK